MNRRKEAAMCFSALTARMKSGLSRFGREDRGYVTIEALIAVPVLLWLFAAGWVYFDVFRQQSVNQKANYVLGDMLSRETDPITSAYMDNAHNLLGVLNKSQTDSALRVTVVQFDGDADQWTVQWSQARGLTDTLSNSDLQEYMARLPNTPSGDQLILVETWDAYDPALEVGLGAFNIRTYSFTRPRYAPQLVFDA
jgi:Flp pilus assembly protein TadG